MAEDKSHSTFEHVMAAIFQALIVGGKVFGPIFIHSDRGVAIFNASIETVQAIGEAAHQISPDQTIPPSR